MDDKMTISKAKAKRKYLLIDNDLEGLEYSEVENPIRKGFTAMKVYVVKCVEEIAIEKWGSLEAIAEERERRGKCTIASSEKRRAAIFSGIEKETTFEEMEAFMTGFQLPRADVCTLNEEISPYFDTTESQNRVTVIRDATYEELCQCPILINYYDCMNREIQEGPSWFIKKRFPELQRQTKKTPFNDRRKLGHFCWATSDDKATLIFGTFVTTKWVKHSPDLKIPPFENSALVVAVLRISNALTDLLEREGQRVRRKGRIVGAYLPRGADETLTIHAFEQLPLDVKLFCGIRKQKMQT